MRSFTLVGVLAVLAAGCSGGQTLGTGAGADGTDPTAAPAVGQVKQKSQFADDTIINLVDPGSATITLTADINPTTVQIYYVGDKTTDTTHTVSSPVLVSTVDLAADQTKQHQVNLFNPAFQGGYGTILVQSVGQTPSDVFQTYVQYGGSMFSAGGSVFTGGSYRIPYLSGTLRVVLALTNQSDFAFEVDLSNVGGTDFKAITLEPLSTYKFDTLAAGWHLNGTSSIQIFTNAGGTVAVSGYIDRLLQRIRITPVKAAPYP
jgi:hypothetical protein